MLKTGHLFTFTLVFVVMSGSMFTLGGAGAALGWAFGICAALMLCATLLRYLNGQ